MIRKPTCKDCHYFRPFHQAHGDCRRHPPVVVVADEASETVWPEVLETDWCGDFAWDNLASSLPAPQIMTVEPEAD